jgi:two-component system phosphate regulon sensor histidine kinase PhoR
MKGQNAVFRKNFSLIVAFLVLTSVTLIIGLVVAYQLTSKNIESEFVSRKPTLPTKPLALI